MRRRQLLIDELAGSGLQHPNFVRIVEQLTTTGTAEITNVARALAA